MTSKPLFPALKSPNTEERPRRGHPPRHYACRRIRLAARPQLAGGVQGSCRSRPRHPRPSRSRERLPDRNDGRYGGAPKTPVPGDERPHQGGRFVRADEGRAVRIWLLLQEGRRAAPLLPHAARGRRGGNHPRRRRRGRGKALFPHWQRRPFERPSPAALGLRRQGLRIFQPARARHPDRQGSRRSRA